MSMSKLTPYFEQDTKEKCVRFIGDKLEIFIPMRYQLKNYLAIEDKISALGIFSMKVNDSIEGGLQLPAVIQIDPVETYEATINDVKYLVCVLTKGGKIMTSTEVLQDDKVGYFMWTEYLSLGRMPEFIDYEGTATLFDDLREVTGRGIDVDSAIIGIILAQMNRDPDDINIFYRHTRMLKKPFLVNLRNVGYGPSSTHARVVGSYSDDGRNAALLNQSDQNHKLEDFFRL